MAPAGPRRRSRRACRVAGRRRREGRPALTASRISAAAQPAHTGARWRCVRISGFGCAQSAPARRRSPRAALAARVVRRLGLTRRLAEIDWPSPPARVRPAAHPRRAAATAGRSHLGDQAGRRLAARSRRSTPRRARRRRRRARRPPLTVALGGDRGAGAGAPEGIMRALPRRVRCSPFSPPPRWAQTRGGPVPLLVSTDWLGRAPRRIRPWSCCGRTRARTTRR